MKILLISGHGAGDPGAMGNGCREADLTRGLVNLIAPILRKYATVDVYNQSHNAYADAQRGSLHPGYYDYVFEVHFNAGGGRGAEMWVTMREAGTGVEQAVVNRMASFFTNRGVKRADFSVIATLKNQGMSAGLLETCFIDSAEDMKVYQSRKKEIAQAIAEGIAEGFHLKPAAPGVDHWEQHGSEWKYQFKDGSYKVSGWLSLKDGDYLFDEKGWMLRGWQKANGNWFYLDKSGRCIKNCVRTIKDGNSSDDTYAFDARGHMLTNTWVGKNFFGETGRYLPNYGKKICSTCGQEIKK